MKRCEAVALLKELVTFEFIEASWVSIVNIKENDYGLQFKTDSCVDIKEFAERKNLVTDINSEKNICTVHDP